MSVSGFFERAADESDIVGSTAAASGLADDNSQMVGVIIAGQNSVHDLTHYDERRVTCIIVYIF